MIAQLTSHLWQSTLFAIAAGLLTLAFRRNRAQVRFSLWLCASLKFFVPFGLLMSLGSQIHWTPAAQEVVSQYATPAVAFAVEYVTEPFAAHPVATSVDWTFAIFFGLWACGFLAIAIIRLRLWFRVRAAVHASKPLDIPSPVGIRSAPGLLEPGVVGLLHPVLLLPEGITDRLTSSELEAVLAHELSHVRRRDNLFAAIHMVAEAVFWFHPLVWWIGARMVEERERACDEAVLNLGNQPRVYADAIVSVCKLYAESPLTCVSGVTGSDIRRRIEAIMMNRRGQTLNRAKKVLLAAAGVAALAGPLTVGVVIGLGHLQLPVIHAQSPVVAPPMLPLTVPAVAQAPVASPPPAVATAQPDANRPLIAILFDLSGTTVGEQASARAHAIRFVHELDPADVVSVIVSAGGEVRVAQDFTGDRRRLESAIQSATFPAAVGSAQETLAGLVQAASLLEKVPGRKSLMYYWPGASQVGSLPPALLRDAISAATRANMSLMPVVVQTEGPGRASAAPSGDKEMLERQLNTLLMMRMFLGAPSYKLREIPVVYSAPIATFRSGTPSLPGGASSVSVYPGVPGGSASADARFASISTPLSGLSGTITITSEIRRRANNGREGGIVATLIDQAKSPEMHRSNLGMDPGAYVANTTIRESATNRFLTDSVNFEVK